MAKNKSKNKPYTVVFDYKDKESLYKKPAVLSAAAHWNFDEMLMAYIAAGMKALLKGPTDWGANYHRMKKIRKLALEFIKYKDDFDYDGNVTARKVFKLINKCRLTSFWD